MGLFDKNNRFNIANLITFGNIAAGLITGVQRFDKQKINLHLGSDQIPTGRNKFGAVIGDDVKLGIGCLIYPGRIIGPSSEVPPGSVITKNIA